MGERGFEHEDAFVAIDDLIADKILQELSDAQGPYLEIFNGNEGEPPAAHVVPKLSERATRIVNLLRIERGPVSGPDLKSRAAIKSASDWAKAIEECKLAGVVTQTGSKPARFELARGAS